MENRKKGEKETQKSDSKEKKNGISAVRLSFLSLACQ